MTSGISSFSGDEAYKTFYSLCIGCDFNLSEIAKLIPKNAKNFTYNESDKSFVLTYEKPQKASVDHDWEKLKTGLKGVTIKIDKVVTGKIIPARSSSAELSRIEFASGVTVDIPGIAAKALGASSISLQSIGASEDDASGVNFTIQAQPTSTYNPISWLAKTVLPPLVRTCPANMIEHTHLNFGTTKS